MSESSSGSGFTYRAFISYSHADKAWAEWLHKALETYRVPSRLVGEETAAGTIPRRLNPIFRDRDELASAHDLGRKVNDALAKSEALIVICSPASAQSHWVNEEVLAYKRLGRAERIFCVIVDGEPDATGKPGHEAEECFCPALRYTLDANGQPTTERTEPIAADARAGKDGKPNAKLKLIAGLLDVGFDQLKQREQHRKMQRMVAVTSLALVVMAVTIVLAVFALISRHNAVIAKHQAVVAQQAAVRRQKQAEGLVGFMLGDLNNKLHQLGRLDIMQAVDAKAMIYFASLPATDVSDTALAQRAKALEKIGSVRMGQGQLSGALAAFHASTRISSRLAAAAPDAVARQVAYSRTLAFIGMVYWDQGKLAEAQRNFATARKLLQSSLENAPNNLPLLQQVTFLDNDLDHVLAAQGKLHEAVSMARERLTLNERLVKAKPSNTDYGSKLGDTHNELGRLALMRGDLATAIAEYRSDDAIQTRLSTRNPGDHAQLENALLARAMLSRTLALAGDLEDGTRGLQQAVDMADQLARVDPGQTEYQKYVALYSAQLARLRRIGGNAAAAKALTARAITILSELTHKDLSNQDWQGDYAAALIEQAAQSRDGGEIGAARSQVQSALRILEPMLAKNPDDRATLLAAMKAKLLLAVVSTDAATAQTLRTDALQTMQAQNAGSSDPRLLALQIEALLTLDRKDDAQALIKRLWDEGYRDPEFVPVLQGERIAYPINTTFQARLLAAAAQAGHGDNAAPQAGDKLHP